MLEKVVFTPNTPIEIALRYSSGREVEGRFGNQIMYSTTDERVMYLDPAVAQKINMLELLPGEPFSICKRSSGRRGESPQWDVWRAGSTPQAQTQQQPALQTPAAAVPVATPVLAPINTSNGTNGGYAQHSTPATGGYTLGSAIPANGNGAHANGGAARPFPVPAAPPTKIPMNVAFSEVIGWMKEVLDAHHIQWSDAAQQDLLSTALIGGLREGWITVWERGGAK